MLLAAGAKMGQCLAEIDGKVMRVIDLELDELPVPRYCSASPTWQPRTLHPEPNYAPPQNPTPQIVAEILQAASQGDLYKVSHCGSTYDLNVRDNDKRCPLQMAAAHGQAMIVKFLISKGANVNCEDRFGNTPLREALRGNHTEIAQMLQAAGAHMSQCPALVHILTSCLSSDPAVRVPAETTLQALVAQAHGCAIQLLDVVIAAATVSPHVLALAATCLKTCIAKRWKKVQHHAITPDEKAQARVLCTSCLLLLEPALFRIVMAAAAKMLRTDWTASEWPDLLPNVISLASSPDPASARRGMQALHLLVRELSSMSLKSEKQNFILA
jgi:ankyrin repeat protein